MHSGSSLVTPIAGPNGELRDMACTLFHQRTAIFLIPQNSWAMHILTCKALSLILLRRVPRSPLYDTNTKFLVFFAKIFLQVLVLTKSHVN